MPPPTTRILPTCATTASDRADRAEAAPREGHPSLRGCRLLGPGGTVIWTRVNSADIFIRDCLSKSTAHAKLVHHSEVSTAGLPKPARVRAVRELLLWSTAR